MYKEKVKEIIHALPEEELEKVYWSISPILEEYQFKKELQSKGVKVTEVVMDTEHFLEKWEQAFTPNVSEEEKQDLHYDQYKWHVFSYKKRFCLEEEKARGAFDQLNADTFYEMYEEPPVIYRDAPMIYQCEQANQVVAADFNAQRDVYVFDPAFTWTYIQTHEPYYGPYFVHGERK